MPQNTKVPKFHQYQVGLTSGRSRAYFFCIYLPDMYLMSGPHLSEV